MTSAAKQLPLNNVYGVSSQYIDEVWAQIKPMVNRSLEYAYDKYKAKDIYRFLKNKDMQLFVVMRNKKITSFLITQIVIYPQKKVLSGAFAAGAGLEDAPAYADVMEKWGRELGCDDVEIGGRKGWARIFKPCGYGDAYTVVRKSL